VTWKRACVLWARAPDYFVALKERLEAECTAAFVAQPTQVSASQQQVSDALRGMGLWVEDEFRCAKSGYSIDMRVHRSDAREEGLVGRRRGWVRI
jgi:hypothetical protein